MRVDLILILASVAFAVLSVVFEKHNRASRNLILAAYGLIALLVYLAWGGINAGL